MALPDALKALNQFKMLIQILQLQGFTHKFDIESVFVSDAHAIYLLVDADRKISSHYEKGKYSIGNFLKFFLSLIRNTG